MFAYVTAEGIQHAAGRIPSSGRRLDTQQWVLGLADADVAVQRACGWYAVVNVAQPADTATHTHVRSLALVEGVPTVTWNQREWTPEELTLRQHEANRIAIEDAMVAAIAELDNLIAAPPLTTVAAGTMTTAQLSNALRTLRNEAQATRSGAQTVALRLKQSIKLIRGDYETVN